MTRPNRRWNTDRDNPGMDWQEAEAAFLRSRRLGIHGAYRAAKPRTIEDYRGDLKLVFDFMRSRQITHYNHAAENDILDFIEHIQGNGWSPATQRKRLISLKAFLRWVERDPDCKTAQMPSYVSCLPRIGKEIRRSFIPSPEQMQAFAAGFNRKVVWGLRDYTALCLMLDTGARIGEICNLEPEDIKWDNSLVNLDGKTGERLVPFDREQTGALLKNWLRVRTRYAHAGSNKVFITRYGGECVPNAFSQSFNDNRRFLGTNKGVGDVISPHTVRHYFCTMYLVNGGSLHNLQRITGHKNVQTLMIYVHLAQQMTSVAEEHSRVSPLKKLLNAPEKKRNLVRLQAA